MTELTGIDAVAALAVVLAIPFIAYGLWLKRESDRLSRLIEKEEAELARRSAE